PAGRFLMNYSIGYGDELDCLPACTFTQVFQTLDTPLSRAMQAAEWKMLTRARWPDFVVGVAAGNERDSFSTFQYRGLGVAAFDSYMSVATLPDLMSFQQEAANWSPPGGVLPSLVSDAEDLAVFQQRLVDLGVTNAPPADNVLLVGSGTPGIIAGQVSESSFSDSSPDVFAVGQEVQNLSETVQGTSFAAPQVTGLASYLWLLSGGAHAKTSSIPDLRTMSASVTKKAILQNTQSGNGINLIDAYAAALSIDGAALPTPSTAPVRLALLDVDDNDRFDEVD